MKLPEQKMKLEYFKEEGRGLVATESIKRGEKVLEIPQEAIITVEVALKESLLREKKKLAELQEWSILATFLAETAQNLSTEDNSSNKYRFATYVKALPRSTGSVLEWPESDVRTLLAGSPSLFFGVGAKSERGGGDCGNSSQLPGVERENVTVGV